MRVHNFSVFTEDRDDRAFEMAYKDCINAFPNSYDSKKNMNGVVLKYRRGQSVFARQVMNAIRYNQILVVQAGVGIGKTIGYLFPVFCTYHHVKKMKHFVISTSNIGLQQQLLTDINMVSNMLGIELKAVIAKGVNNYACLKRIYHALDDSRNSESEKAVIQTLLDEIQTKSTIDKDELTQVSKEVWDLMKLKNRGVCSNCSYSKDCLYRKISQDVNDANIVITNHNMLVKSALDHRTFFQQADTFIFDEAHQLENAIRDIQGNYLNLDEIFKTLNYFVENIITDKFQQDYIQQTLKSINYFFNRIKKRGTYYYFKNKKEATVDIIDCDKIPFYVGNLESIMDDIVDRLTRIYRLIESINYKNDYRMEQIKQWIYIFNDMKKKDKSENIYWADFFMKNAIKIGYTNKKISTFADNLVGRNVPVIFTSGTVVDSKKTYDYFKECLGLNDISTPDHPVYDGQICASPYDYINHSLFYYDKNITNPNYNHQKYLDELVIKIGELLKITNGRSLVLFTSKSDMNYVYEKLNKEEFSFDILIQGRDQSNHNIYSEFENKSKTCLFSTGAWEGLDVKGKSLSNVIITRLPFATDNAIMQYRQHEHKQLEKLDNNKHDNSIYFNDMLQKFAQGTGRLIRSKNDKGIICCLDSRFENYSEAIKKILPFEYYTNDIENVYQFSKKYITNQDGPRGPYKKRVKKEDN